MFMRSYDPFLRDIMRFFGISKHLSSVFTDGLAGDLGPNSRRQRFHEVFRSFGRIRQVNNPLHKRKSIPASSPQSYLQTAKLSDFPGNQNKNSFLPPYFGFASDTPPQQNANIVCFCIRLIRIFDGRFEIPIPEQGG